MIEQGFLEQKQEVCSIPAAAYQMYKGHGFHTGTRNNGNKNTRYMEFIQEIIHDFKEKNQFSDLSTQGIVATSIPSSNNSDVSSAVAFPYMP